MVGGSRDCWWDHWRMIGGLLGTIGKPFGKQLKIAEDPGSIEGVSERILRGIEGSWGGPLRDQTGSIQWSFGFHWGTPRPLDKYDWGIIVGSCGSPSPMIRGSSRNDWDSFGKQQMVIGGPLGYYSNFSLPSRGRPSGAGVACALFENVLIGWGAGDDS